VTAARLSRADPAHKVDHEKNAKAFVNRLDALSRGFTSGPATCQRKDLITSHGAFGYLAQRFDLRQVAINALSPEQEPNASEIAKVSTCTKANSVTTLHAQTLTRPAIATTVAREIGARAATLDPVEGLSKQSSGKNCFEIMGSNLTALQAGQECP
jgi:zinc transport system substrate-binding protein